jgi:uncharacterized protein involved in exopolysaccharide biosynthesis
MNDSHEPVGQPRTEISLVSIGSFFARNIGIIGTCVLLFALAAAALAFWITPKYRSEVVFSPASGSGSMGADLGNIGGLAAMAGISIGGAGKKSEEALEYLRSRGFTAHFIEKHALLPVLFANKWDAHSGTWRGEAPTLAEGVKRFSERIRQIAEDRRTGIVTLAILWRDRNVAAEWANELVAEADDALRQRAVAELRRSIEYLKTESSQAPLIELQSAVYKVMESELKDEMLARTRDAYAFKILDPAVPRDPKDTDSPNKVLFVVLGAGLGILVGAAWAGARQGRTRRREH